MFSNPKLTAFYLSCRLKLKGFEAKTGNHKIIIRAGNAKSQGQLEVQKQESKYAIFGKFLANILQLFGKNFGIASILQVP